METIVKATIGTEKYLTTINARQHVITTDEPTFLGGKDKAINPFELLASSLASCTAATLRMYMDRKKWDAAHIDVTVKLNYNKKEGYTNFDRLITFGENHFTDQILDELYQIANRCPVHKILEGQVGISTLIK